MGLWGFVDAIAPHYHYLNIFNILMVIWILYEEFITIKRNHNIIPTVISMSIGFILYSGVSMAVINNFADIKWDIVLLFGLLYGLWVNYLSLKR
jgi:hypothetical protein